MSDFPPGDYKTRSGRDAKVLGIVPEPTETDFPLLGATLECGEWKSTCWTKDGRRNPNGTVSSRDLFRPPREWWATVWKDAIGVLHMNHLHDTLAEAQDELCGKTHFVCHVKITEVIDE
jgi:hypothetical protein